MRDWKGVVQSLLTKAERTDSDEERAALIERAGYLMVKYQIEDAVAREKSGEDQKVESCFLKVGSPYKKRKLFLAAKVSYYLGGSHTVIGSEALHVFAYPQDLERIKTMFISLQIQALMELSNIKVPKWESTRSFKESFFNGFVDMVSKRLQSARKNAVQDSGTGKDLVLVRQMSRLDSARKSEYPNLIKVDLRGNTNSAYGYSSGIEAGARADIGHSRMSGRRSAITS